MNTRDWVPSKQIRALVFGRYKTGKTWGALTFPRPNVLDFDKGIAVIRNPEFVKKHGMLNVEYQTFKELKLGKGGVPSDHNVFDDACRYFDSWMTPAKRDQFDTWVLDSATTLSLHAMYKGIVLLGGGRGFGAKPLSHTHKEAMDTGLLFPKIQDWGAERSMVEQFVAMLLDTDKHVIVICHEKEMTDDNGTPIQTVPLLTGKSVDTVPIMFDEVWHTRRTPSGDEFKYVIQTKPEGILKVGSRYGIADGTAWNFQSVKTALDTISTEQSKLIDAASSRPQASVSQSPVAAGGVK